MKKCVSTTRKKNFKYSYVFSKNFFLLEQSELSIFYKTSTNFHFCGTKELFLLRVDRYKRNKNIEIHAAEAMNPLYT